MIIALKKGGLILKNAFLIWLLTGTLVSVIACSYNETTKKASSEQHIEKGSKLQNAINDGKENRAKTEKTKEVDTPAALENLLRESIRILNEKNEKKRLTLNTIHEEEPALNIHYNIHWLGFAGTSWELIDFEYISESTTGVFKTRAILQDTYKGSQHKIYAFEINFIKQNGSFKFKEMITIPIVY